MSVQIDAVIRLSEVDQNGLPEQAGEHGADNAAVDVTIDGAVERESDEKEIDAADRPDEGTVAAETTDAGGQPGSGASPDDDPDDAGEADDGSDDEEVPQPLTFVGLPEDFDWRKLTPRVYGKSLPPLDPVDLQSLEHSIVSRGILDKILIDKRYNIIVGNTRWDICVEKGIVPPVAMISGLTEEEKEELAISSNVARRQLKDPDVERQVREARLENMFKAKEQNSKKWPLKRIARAIGVSVATVSLRWRERQNSKGEIASMLDARRKYTEAIELEAVRLVEEGMPNADVARTLMMHPKAVQRAWNKEKKRQAANTATKPTTIEDIKAIDGVPELHRWAPEQLGQNTQAYIDRLKAQAAEIRKNFEEISEIDERTDLSVYFSLGQAFFNFGLRNTRSGGGEIDVEEAAPSGDSCPNKAGQEPDTILLGTVMATERDEAFIALCVGGGGVIDNRDGCLDRHAPLKVDEVVRVRVEDFDWKRGLWKLQPVARQTVAPAPGTSAAGSDRDERCSPYADLAGRKAGPKEVRA